MGRVMPRCSYGCDCTISNNSQTNIFQDILQLFGISEKTKGQPRMGKIVSALVHTFPHFFRIFPQDISQNQGLFKENTKLGGLPNANAKSQRFSYAISQIAPLPPVVALNRKFKSQIAAKYAAFWHAVSQIALTSFLWCP